MFFYKILTEIPKTLLMNTNCSIAAFRFYFLVVLYFSQEAATVTQSDVTSEVGF